MFGFSLTKLLFTAAAIAIVWYGFKWFARYQEVQAENRKFVRQNSGGGAAKRTAAESATPEAEDMVACAACSSFVVAGRAKNCGRDDCPYPE